MSEPNYVNPTPERPMKWHKFLIYFSLWAGAVMQVYSGIQLLTGLIYEDTRTANAVYMMYPSLKSINTLFGVLMLLLAVYYVYTRFRLAGFRANGPKLLSGVYIYNLILAAAYIFAMNRCTGMEIGQLVDANTTSQIVSALVMVAVNKAYYGKRAYMFVN